MSENKSVHSDGIKEIYTMPICEIHRPIPSVLDTQKVDSIAETLETDPKSVPPLDVRRYFLVL